jgi:16S rRNA (cytosine967-C5)-methyltransferase
MPERDRALATEIVYGVLRRRSLLDRALAGVSARSLGNIDAPLLEILRIAAYQVIFLSRIPQSAAVNEAVGLARRRLGRPGAAFANAVLRALCVRAPFRPEDLAGPRPGEGEDDEALREWLACDASFPRFLVDRFLDRHGAADGEALLRASNQPAPVVLRPARRAGGAPALARALEGEGIVTAPSPVLDGALRVVSGAAQHTGVFRRGWFYIQDEGAQIVAMLLSPLGRGDRVADLCAAPGGKILQVAEAPEPPALVLAADRSVSRLRLVRENAGRIGAGPIHFAAMDMMQPALGGRFTRVLLDAPCSGTGVIRRHPEIRWRRTEESIRRHAGRQAAALRAATGLLAPGGRLVYAVCSLEPEEGPAQIEDLLRHQPGLRRIDARDILPMDLHGFVAADGSLRTLPHLHDVDGFFAAVLALC